MCEKHAPRLRRRQLLAVLPAAALLAGLRPARADAPTLELPPPGPRDTCPVCGMFAAQYPEWVATVLWNDGVAVHFDGPKDFFKYLDNLAKYAPGRSAGDIAAMGVTEYYGLTMIDARTARYVIGSDVYGPMGHELVPLATEADSADFLKDHFGKREVLFDDVTTDMLAGLDEGRFE